MRKDKQAMSIARRGAFFGIYVILLYLSFQLWGAAAFVEPFITFNAHDAWVFVVGGTVCFLLWLESTIYWIIIGWMKRFNIKVVLMILLSALVSYEMFYIPPMYINDIASRTGPVPRLPDANRLMSAARSDDVTAFKETGVKGADLDAQEVGMLGETPLIAAALVDGTNVFFYLLSAGATVDARDREGKTALMSAVMLGDSNIVKTKALITAGADVNAMNRHGATVLKYAKWAAEAGHPAKTTIDLLEQRGAKEEGTGAKP